MTDTVFTQDMLDALSRAYALGILRLEYDGKVTHYRTLDEMERAMNRIQREIDGAAGKTRSRQIRMKTRRGLDSEC